MHGLTYTEMPMGKDSDERSGCPMSKDDFVSKDLDELTGLLLKSLFEVEKFKAPEQFAAASLGRTMMEQQRKAKALLGRVYDELKPQATGAKK